ncbi:MAG TPA: 50S ribosomal protein L24 [Vampirovibrionales bacterium]
MRSLKKKRVYTKQTIKPLEKRDRVVSSRAWSKGRTNLRKAWDLKLGDLVFVLTGKDKGKVAKIIKMLPKQAKAIVEGINIVKKHKKLPNQTEGQITEVEAPIWLCKLAIAVEKEGKKVPSRIKRENGKRIAVKTGEAID